MSSRPSIKLAPDTLCGRLTFYFALTFLGLLLLTMGGLYVALGSLLDQQFEQDLLEDVEEFQLIYRSAGLAGLQQEILRETSNSQDQVSEFFQLYNDHGQRLFSSAGDWWQTMRLDETTFSSRIHAGISIERATFLHSEHAYVTVLGEIGDGVYLYAGETLEGRQDILGLVMQAFLLALVFTVPLAAIIVWRISVSSSRGIKMISEAVREVEHGNFASRVHIESSVREIRHLADAFNSMVARINNLVSEMREMIDNIAHDLRSPLGRIRAISENALTRAQKPSEYIRAAENTLGECDRLLRLINNTLDVAEVEAGVYLAGNTEVDLYTVVSEASELFEPVAQEKNLNLQVVNLEHCIIDGNLNNLQRMVSNLIDNAIKYTPQRGRIEINMIRDDSGCRIIVADTGVGIAEANQPRVFERFYRCDESRSSDGCGLGLSFSIAVARQHGGDIKLQSTPNRSTMFTIQLPC